ncbi:MAG: peptide-binding protein [Solirubrobacterales bacterium]|nr:peptide-binding protein [Solirubrobacterales bacterium]
MAEGTIALMEAFERLRDRTVDRLGSHYAAGHLHTGTLERRLEAALVARSPDELSAVAWDLPFPGAAWWRQLWSMIDGRPRDRRCTGIAFQTLPAVTLDVGDGPRSWVVGRSRRCDVVLSDGAVSRRHLLVASRGGRCSVRDLGSTNGLEVNGRTTRTAVLWPGDVLMLGRAVMAVVR